MKARSSAAITATGRIQSPIDDASTLRDVIAGDQRAWRALVRACEQPLRTRIRECLASSGDYAAADVDDVMGAFWLRIVEGEMRWLRAFNPSQGASLLDWLTLHVTQVAHEHGRKLRKQQRREVCLDQARSLPVPTTQPVGIGGIDRAIRDAVRDVIREEFRTVLHVEISQLRAGARPTAMATEYLSIAEAAETAHVHEATIRSWLNSGRLTGFRAGRHRRVKRADLERFMTSSDAPTSVDLDERAAKLAAI